MIIAFAFAHERGEATRWNERRDMVGKWTSAGSSKAASSVS